MFLLLGQFFFSALRQSDFRGVCCLTHSSGLLLPGEADVQARKPQSFPEAFLIAMFRFRLNSLVTKAKRGGKKTVKVFQNSIWFDLPCITLINLVSLGVFLPFSRGLCGTLQKWKKNIKHHINQAENPSKEHHLKKTK